ncbi:hypothetical protein niasHT_037615 [Heterodera trifolii]|uniref:CXXC-type zinc finger protein 1 n=1 Tax=Heterodera trifolii TaxID=157864 RepID=A0ABD2IIP5_9BILA
MVDNNNKTRLDVVKSMENKVQITPRNVVPLADAHELVALANSIQSARDFVKCQAVGKLEMIAEQMEFLRKQAIEVLRKAQHDNELHCVECKVKKVEISRKACHGLDPKIYFLYQQCPADGGEPPQQKCQEQQCRRRFFSLISPDEWGGECALARRQMHFEGAYRLEFDQSWSQVQQSAKDEATIETKMPNSGSQKMQILERVDRLLQASSPSSLMTASMALDRIEEAN